MCHTKLFAVGVLWLCVATAPAAGDAPAAPTAPPPAAKGARNAQWTVHIDQLLTGVPLDRAFAFWWDLRNTRRFIPTVNSVLTTKANSSYQEFEIGQRIPFPTQQLQTVARGAVTVLRHAPGFVSAHTTGLVTAPAPEGAWFWGGHRSRARPLVGMGRPRPSARHIQQTRTDAAGWGSILDEPSRLMCMLHGGFAFARQSPTVHSTVCPSPPRRPVGGLAPCLYPCP